MNRLVLVLCLLCLAAIGATGYSMLSNRAADTLGVPTTPTPPAAAVGPAASAAQALHEARRQCSLPALDALIAALRTKTGATPSDAETWHVLAEASLERAQQRAHLRGIAVGSPVYAELPAEVTADLDAGLAAIARARELGDHGGDLYRIEASLMSQHITGIGSALQWNSRIENALLAAGERGRDNPRLHTVLGLRKLLAPSLFGGDPQAALQHFEFAAKALADDERPAVFAAMASYLQQKRQQAVAWLEQAVARNPNNVFARVVLQRVRRDEPEPFARDVSADEAAAAAAAK
jgi:cytochrome c-type biogenesis protein CcmH/NrfG